MTSLRDERSRVLRHVWNSNRSSFYREHHGNVARETILPLRDEEAWQRIPLLTRDDIGKTPFWERLYTDRKDVHVVRPTSGTSGRSIMLSARASPLTTILDDFERHGVHATGGLFFMNPPHMFESHMTSTVPIIGGDPLHPDMSVWMARRAGANILVVYIHMVGALESALRASGLAEQLRGVYLFGEYLSASARDHLARLFPNAIFINTYGASELYGEVAAVTFTLDDLGTEHYRLRKPADNFLEIATDETVTATPAAGTEGELVVTSLSTAADAFPMIRYRTGDQVRVFQVKGTGNFSFDVLGRSALDKIKLMGGVLWPHEIERALSAVFGRAFRGEYLFERALDESGKEYGIVHLPEDLFLSLGPHAPERIARELRVTPVRSYADGVRDGFYGDIRITRLQSADDAPRKARRIRQAGSGTN